MKKLIIIGAILIIAGGLAWYFTSSGKTNEDTMNQEESTNTTPPADYGDKIAKIRTNQGTFEIEFYPQDAPKTVENFIRLAESGYYDEGSFHRVVKDFVIQGGDPTGTGSGGESIYGETFEDELNPSAPSFQAGYQKGVVAMANRGPNTNGSQFFVMLETNPLPNLYTIFGKVRKGQEVVDKIGQVEVDANDRPIEPIVIEKVTIENK